MRNVLTKWATAYKLTAQDGTTLGGACQWVKGKANPHGVRSGFGGLCGPGFYHGYHVPELAGFLNPNHANIQNPRLWEVQIRGIVEEDRGILKLGATEMRVVRELPYVEPTDSQRQAFAIYCGGAALALRDVSIPAWEHWAAEWLAGRGTEAERVRARRAAAAYAADASADAYAAHDAAAYAAAADAVYAADAAHDAAAAAAAYAANAAAARDIIQDALAFALAYQRPTSQEN